MKRPGIVLLEEESSEIPYAIASTATLTVTKPQINTRCCAATGRTRSPASGDCRSFRDLILFSGIYTINQLGLAGFDISTGTQQSAMGRFL